MIVAKDPVDFFKQWRKKERISQIVVAKLVGIGLGTIGDFESRRRVTGTIAFKLSVLLTEFERLQFFDLMAVHFSEDKGVFLASNDALLKIRKRRALHDLTDNDVVMLRLAGVPIENKRLKERPVPHRGPRNKKK